RPVGLRRFALRQLGEELPDLGQELSEVRSTRTQLGAELLGLAAANADTKRLDPGPVRGGAPRLPAASDQHLCSALPRVRDEFLGEPTLPDSGLADEEIQDASAAHRALEASQELLELLLATDEWALRFPVGDLSWRRWHGRRLERGILPEDRLFQLAQLPSRLDPELVDEEPPSCVIGLEGFRLAPGAVERAHQLAAQVLSQRMSRDQGL